MELTWEQWKAMKKELRRRFSVIGWILLLYYGIMNLSVILTMFFEVLLSAVSGISSGNADALLNAAQEASGSGWGYFLAAGIGFLILLLWEKPKFLRKEVFAKGKPMKPAHFFAILCVFLGAQMVYQVAAVTLEMILNGFGFSIMEGLIEMALDTDRFSMFLYAGILAPITEEILFRGVIQRRLMPFGKKFAIFCSAFAFGIFHGSLLQSPYAFLSGLVLGYVASEYSICWAMLLHMINNLVIADMLIRLTSGMNEVAAGVVIWAVMAAFFAAALIVLIAQRKKIREYCRQERMNRTYLRCFFSSAGMIILMIVMGLSMVYSGYMMIRPL